MRTARWALVCLAALLAVVGCLDVGVPSEASDDGEANAPEEVADATSPPIALEEVVSGLEDPTLVTRANDGTDRLFVLEQRGTVRIVENGSLVEEPYLDVTNATRLDARARGLLSLAFSPNFATDGRLYVSRTDTDGDSVLSRFTVDDPPTGRPSSEETLLHVDEPSQFHNGGHVLFGPDGFLYYGLGDGGPLPDVHGNGQNVSTLHGSLLRLDVSGEEVQAPPDNPFVGDEEGHDLVWAHGLRNPWRFSFDRQTGDLFIGDVGGDIEEVDHQPASSDGGENYGWADWHGERPSAGDTPREGYTFPIITYNHTGGSAVIGGHVYRGSAIPSLEGAYVFGDLNGTIRAAHNTSEGWRSQLLETDLSITSFGEDEAGEMYVVARAGTVYRIVQA